MGKWVGRVVGGVVGGWLGSSLGIAGAIFGVSIATVATIPLLIFGILAGDSIGKRFSKVICPECGKEIKKALKQEEPPASSETGVSPRMKWKWRWLVVGAVLGIIIARLH